MAFVILAVMLLAAEAVQGDSDPYILKKHVGFFDRNGDGIVHLSESIEGFKALGVNTVESTAFSTAIHTALSSFTRPGEPFDPTFPIVVEKISLARHTSDSGVYGEGGSFVPVKFEKIFENHAHTRPDALNETEVDELLKANRIAGDFNNWLAASAEWHILYRLGKNADGFLPRRNIRNVYDGSFFYELEKNVSSGIHNMNSYIYP